MTTPGLASARYRFDGWDEAQEFYHSRGLTDGLPIVPPTETKVQAMLDAVELAPSDVIASEGVRQKEFTAEKVAINAVMAGCLPEYMPIIVAAVEAISERTFNLHANTTTTGGTSLLAVVSGRIVQELKINSGTGLLGHGFRANASIGRALALVKINVYGSVPHEIDKSTFTHGGKYTYCFAENDEISPWEPLRVDRGFPTDSSTVTMFAAGAPVQVSTAELQQPEEFLLPVADSMIGLGPRHREMLVVLSPEIMGYVKMAGWTKRQISEFLFERAKRTGIEWNEWLRFTTSLTGNDLDASHPAVRSADGITVLCAGGAAGPMTAVINTFSGSESQTRRIKVRE
ncbi:MAG TPA: hypothetical protein DCP37_03300 [Dehalococcoidia bacterium]|nr:hypothetical protein [Dehalococcoidia bacterium]